MITLFLQVVRRDELSFSLNITSARRKKPWPIYEAARRPGGDVMAVNELT